MAAKVIFTAAATFTRLSLFLFYYRLIKDGGKSWFRWAVHANVAYSVAIMITFLFLAIFQCTPVKNYWTFGAPADTCMDEGAATLAAGIINCVADFFCTVTPIPLVMSLQMPRRQRVAVNVLFSLGFIVTIAGVVRTWYIYKSVIDEYDQTWFAYPLWIAAAIEIDLGVICASAPVLRPLLAKLPFSFSAITSSLKSKSHSTGHTPKGSKHNQSKSTNQMAIESKTSRSKAPGSADDRSTQREVIGLQYEMGTWLELEGGNRTSRTPSQESQDAILRNEEVKSERTADFSERNRSLHED